MDFERDRLPVSDLIALRPACREQVSQYMQRHQSWHTGGWRHRAVCRESLMERACLRLPDRTANQHDCAGQRTLARTVDSPRSRRRQHRHSNSLTPGRSSGLPDLGAGAVGFQLESTVSLKTEAAAVINVTPNHLDRYPSFFAYAACKERIFGADRQVINRDDVWSSSMRRTDVGDPRLSAPDGRPAAGLRSDIAGPDGHLLRIGSDPGGDRAGCSGRAQCPERARQSMALTIGLTGSCPSDCQRVLRNFAACRIAARRLARLMACV